MHPCDGRPKGGRRDRNGTFRNSGGCNAGSSSAKHPPRGPIAKGRPRGRLHPNDLGSIRSTVSVHNLGEVRPHRGYEPSTLKVHISAIEVTYRYGTYMALICTRYVTTIALRWTYTTYTMHIHCTVYAECRWNVDPMYIHRRSIVYRAYGGPTDYPVDRPSMNEDRPSSLSFSRPLRHAHYVPARRRFNGWLLAMLASLCVAPVPPSAPLIRHLSGVDTGALACGGLH